MKKLKVNYKITPIVAMVALGVLFSCQVENEEGVSELEAASQNEQGLTSKKGEEQNCTWQGRNAVKETDIANPVNDGKIDDRSCYSNYHETLVGSTRYGNYNITANSNHIDTNTLQPRIERSLDRTNNKSGSYVQLKGKFRILEVGYTGNDGLDGTYIAQAKGQHSKRPGAATNDGSPDPAICLFLAKPVYGLDKNGKYAQLSFNIYREQIITRGGSGAAGRKIVFLKNVKRGHPTDFELKVGFRTSGGEKIHYANAKIGGTNFYWNIPEPERGLQSGIRYGAYRVKGGRARIQWANTQYIKVQK